MPEMNQVKISEPRSLLSWAEGWKTLGSDVSKWLWLLESDSLCTEARRRTRLETFGDPPIEPALTVLVKSLETEAPSQMHESIKPICILDDDLSVLNSLQRLLASDGFDARMFDSSDLFLAYVREH